MVGTRKVRFSHPTNRGLRSCLRRFAGRQQIVVFGMLAHEALDEFAFDRELVPRARTGRRGLRVLFGADALPPSSAGTSVCTSVIAPGDFR